MKKVLQMHSERRSSWQKEFCYASMCGFLFGGTNTVVGHPFDTIKTKMQAQTGNMGLKQGYIDTVKSVMRHEGPIGFYRGFYPPFVGSILYRSTQFSVFEAFYTRWESDKAMRKEIPYTFGLEWRTLCSGIMAGSARTLVECPFEYAKVKGQTGQKWQFSQLYKGY